MLITILILIAAVVLFFGCTMLFKSDSKKSAPMWKHIVAKTAKLISIVLLIVGVNRFGLGTTYYLTESNPAILQTMATNMQAAQQAAANEGVGEFVRDNMDAMIENAPVLGNAKADKTIFVFSAASCGYCRRVHGELTRVIEARDDVRIVMKNFSIHGVMSEIPARATIAAKMQSNDLAAKLDTEIMTNEYYTQDDVADQAKAPAKLTANIMKMAKKVGLDTAKLERDMNSETVNNELAQVSELAQRFNIGGTPFLIIQGATFPGAVPYETIMEALN
ncbi:MAG: DsbA family protein [Rickettsiales bacterium]|jgi:protein-disulfide isomerase|nr:DsbA family protein [Rickettsiales bacterium]